MVCRTTLSTCFSLNEVMAAVSKQNQRRSSSVFNTHGLDMNTTPCTAVLLYVKVQLKHRGSGCINEVADRGRNAIYLLSNYWRAINETPPSQSIISVQNGILGIVRHMHIRPVGFVFGLWSEYSSMDKHSFKWANIRPWTNTSRNFWRIFINGTNTPSETRGECSSTEWIPYEEHEANIYPWNEYPLKNMGRIFALGTKTLSKVWGEYSSVHKYFLEHVGRVSSVDNYLLEKMGWIITCGWTPSNKCAANTCCGANSS